MKILKIPVNLTFWEVNFQIFFEEEAEKSSPVAPNRLSKSNWPQIGGGGGDLVQPRNTYRPIGETSFYSQIAIHIYVSSLLNGGFFPPLLVGIVGQIEILGI